MSPLFLVGCGLLVAAVLLGATGAPAAVWVLIGAAGIALFWRGATTTPKRTIRSHSAAGERAKGDRAKGDRARSDRAKGDRSKGDQAKDDRAGGGRSGGGRSGGSGAATPPTTGRRPKAARRHR